MVGAGAELIQKLAKMPPVVAIKVVTVATASIGPNLRVTKNAIAPGEINKAIAKMIPTAFSVATTVNEINASIP